MPCGRREFKRRDRFRTAVSAVEGVNGRAARPEKDAAVGSPWIEMYI
jgi:hypothetical protein